MPIRRALLSVSDKSGLAEFGAELHRRGIELLSTGGSARVLVDAGLPVREVSDYTGFPELMDGRLKTLHPRVHGGLLGRRGSDDAVMREHGIEAIDLLVVNLYPFAQTIAGLTAALSRRSRTSISAARRCCGPPPRTMPTSRCWSTRLTMPAC